MAPRCADPPRSSMRIPRLAAPAAACVVASVVLPLSTPVAVASPASAGATVAGPAHGVVLGLPRQDRGALHALARAGNRHRSAPAVALQRALPSDTQRHS